MNISIRQFLGLAVLNAALIASAHAAGDAQPTERAHPLDHGPRAVLSPWAAERIQASEASAHAAADDTRPTMLLDHGPRAQTTPWLNEQRRQRDIAEQARGREATTANVAAASGD